MIGIRDRRDLPFVFDAEEKGSVFARLDVNDGRRAFQKGAVLQDDVDFAFFLFLGAAHQKEGGDQ
jgi:hypothetical protein